MRLFNEPKGTQINSTELRKIKVNIYRNIPGNSAANELQRDIINPEDVMVKRRTGEESKPIFEREELTKAISVTQEVEERTVTRNANLENKPQTSKRRSVSLSLMRNRSYSHRRTSFLHSRYEDYKHNDRESRRSKGSRSKERKEDKQRTQSCHVRDEKRLNEKRRILMIVNQSGDLENEGCPRNKFLFLFITRISCQDQLWLGLFQLVDQTSLSEATDTLCGQ